MLEVVILFCLSSNAQQCREVTFSPGEALTPFQCVNGAQIEISKWLESHPKWSVQRWTCRRAGLEAKL